MSDRAVGPGLFSRWAAGYRAPMATMRALLAQRPDEVTLVSFFWLFGGMMFLGGVVAAMLKLSGVDDAQLSAAIAGHFLGALLLLPLVLYGLSAIASRVVGWLGGAGGWYESRAAFGWGLVLGGPFLAIAQAIEPLNASPTVLGLRWALSFIAFYFWAACLAAAHGFRSPFHVMGGAIALGGVVVGVAIALGRLFG